MGGKKKVAAKADERLVLAALIHPAIMRALGARPHLRRATREAERVWAESRASHTSLPTCEALARGPLPHDPRMIDVPARPGRGESWPAGDYWLPGERLAGS